ncbi:hypothetical protein [Halomonas urumqiensis]|uniref:DUF3108 domain-containing protein n=1 Tax=Halomonas urumqiensis TaxID=1684789 RepID=A0A2N7UHF3_9GAMM|nr:hypothetical protein [Halomonas urumqiensis]PMR79840.1 hypothetical protein C1H70_10180 [Halomonas urumqiensis]PTB02133.1 hypothetical protein C6V82_10575 [Halomonas urumqiensis]GHE21585.1 hypothetical protein GCM10017767_21060 [Halomonas urumqiensis]
MRVLSPCLASWFISLAMLLALATPSAAETTPATPFSARYQLEVSGWPNTTVGHRLTRESGHWQSHMEASLAVAQGSERSRFIIEDGNVTAINYASGYSLMGIGNDYRLTPEELTHLPDRQTALFELSRRAIAGQDCTTGKGCRLDYLDHRGRPERIDYRLLEPVPLSLPAGEFEAVTVEVTEPDEPERRLVFHFHSELPGLLLGMEYHRDGERRSRLALSALSLAQ